MAEFALCLSGGGYRAAMFHLGVMTYLNEIRSTDGSRLLDHVHTITSISGGALPGLLYVVGEKEGKNRIDTFKTLYRQLQDNNLGEKLVKRFNEESPKGTSLIKVLADVYDDIFFHGELFKDILEFVSWDGFHHFAADATDFELGRPFRFQATPEINDPDRSEVCGLVGNWLHRISRDDAKNIRLADIMAATSCFPLVFEPIVYPDDFKGGVTKGEISGTSFLLMDGGLVDNHGIDPVIHAKEHLSHMDREIETYILSDAVNVNNERNRENESKSTSVSPNCIKRCLLILGFVFLFLGGFFLMRIPLLAGAFLMLGFFCFVLKFLLSKFVDWAFRQIEKIIGFEIKYKDFLWKSNCKSIKRFLLTRVGTVYKMVDIIMMGNLKKNSIRNLTNEAETNDKVVLNTLPLFCKGDKWKKILRKGYMGEKFLAPSRKIQKNTGKANGMSTTLWFTANELKQGLPKVVLACGQYTVCWNLLQQARKIRIAFSENPEQMNEAQKLLVELEPLLQSDWKRFNQNPFYKTQTYIA